MPNLIIGGILSGNADAQNGRLCLKAPNDPEGRLVQIPKHFLEVSYNGDHYPGAPAAKGLEGGANCQQFAFELLRHFGFDLPNFRSDQLWNDQEYTVVVCQYEPLDLILVHRRPEAYGAHVVVYIGDGKVIHLSKKVGKPEICTLHNLQSRPEYAVLVGAKRVIAGATPSPA